jgi:CRISPR system Cascade subunit CasE
MIQAELDRARLFEFARSRRLPLRDVDLGYLIHCALRGAFGDHAPHPFSFDDGHRRLTVLGYTEHPSDFLLEHGRAFAKPLEWSICRPGGLMTKPMPASFPPGTRLGFATRICPVIRKAAQGERHRKGAEVDVFLDRCWEEEDRGPVDRESVYRDWLKRHLDNAGAAKIVSATMIGFHRERVTRSTHRNGDGPRHRQCERPDVHFRGTLEVGESSSFQAILRRGIGRHRAFGFGMLLLSPPS